MERVVPTRSTDILIPLLSNSKKIMPIWRYAAPVLTVAALAGCAPTIPLQRNQLDSLSRESTPTAVEQALGQATPLVRVEFSSDNQPFLVRQYLLQTGSRQDMTVVCTPVCIPIVVTVPITTQYILVQRMPSQTMHAWGTIEELSKDPDPAVSNLMPELKVRLEAAAKEQKK